MNSNFVYFGIEIEKVKEKPKTPKPIPARHPAAQVPAQPALPRPAQPRPSAATPAPSTRPAPTPHAQPSPRATSRTDPLSPPATGPRSSGPLPLPACFAPARSVARKTRVAPRPIRQRASAPLLSLQPGPACQLLLPRSATPAPESRRVRRDSLPCSHAEIPGLPPLNRPNPLRPLPIQQSAAPRTLAPPPSRSTRSAAQSPQHRCGHATPLRHQLRKTPQENRRAPGDLPKVFAPETRPHLAGNSRANRSTVSCAARLGSRRRRLPCPADPRSCFVEPPRVDPRNPGAWRNPAPPGPRTPPLHRRRSKSPGLYAASPTASTPSVSCAPTPLASALLPVAKAHPGRQNAARRREPPCRAAAVLALTATDLPEARQGPRWTTHDA